MIKNLNLTRVALALAVLILAGCGGGGSSSTANTAPVANAGAAQTVTIGSLVTLDGRASTDANGDALTYTWSWIYKPGSSNAALSSTTAAAPTFTTDVRGVYVLSLIVNDGKVDSIPVTVVVHASFWTQQAYLKAPNAEAGDSFGTSIAASGDTVVVGARNESSNQTSITNGTSASSDNSTLSAGAAYVFTRSGSTWTQQAYLKAANAGAGDNFGYSVAVSGDTVVVGAFGEASNQTSITNGTSASSDDLASNAGAAYVFTRSGSIWTQQAYFKAPNAEAGDYFGISVAVSGDTVVVGAYREDSNQTSITNGTSASSDNSTLSAGAAYVFTRSGSIWTQQAYLKAPNAGASDQFGTSVAVSGDTVVVAAPYESSSQTSITNGTSASSDDSASYSGAAYVFNRSGSTWTQQAYLKAPNAGADDLFSLSVAVSGDTVVVGATGEDSSQTSITNGTSASSDDLASNAGAAYVFNRSGSTWTQQAYLKAPNAGAGDQFGTSVAVSGDTVVVAAPYESSSQTSITNGASASSDDLASNAGAAYVFNRSGSTWTQQAYLKAPNAGADDLFGLSVALSGDTVVVGATGEDSSQTSISNGTTASSDNSASNAGAAYVFLRE